MPASAKSLASAFYLIYFSRLQQKKKDNPANSVDRDPTFGGDSRIYGQFLISFIQNPMIDQNIQIPNCKKDYLILIIALHAPIYMLS